MSAIGALAKPVEASFGPYQSDSIKPIRCRFLGIGLDMRRREFLAFWVVQLRRGRLRRARNSPSVCGGLAYLRTKPPTIRNHLKK